MTEIYTDGGCRGNGKSANVGALAFVIIKDGVIKKKYGCKYYNVTNNQMELRAIIEGLKYCKENHIDDILVYTDSKYAYQGITDWVYTWEAKHWVTSQKTPVMNKELWKELMKLKDSMRVNFKWVKGHCDDYFNELVDEICNRAMDGNFSSGKTHVPPPRPKQQRVLTAWEILGIEAGSDQIIIKKAFKRLILTWHPDKNSDPKAEEMTKKIISAYESLKK